MTITWKTENRNIADLNPAKYNPRKLTERQHHELGRSMDKFNVADPIIINADNTIIGGHQRVKILQERGYEAVDVRVPSQKLTKDQEKELNLRLNRNTGEWDYTLLADFAEDLLQDVGFSPEELDLIFAPKDKTEDDDVPELPEKAVSKPGEIYVLGRHRVMCGDATSEADTARLMAGQRARMCFTDPPYNVNYQGSMSATGQNKRNGIMNDKMSKPAFAAFLEALSQRILEVTDGGVYICMSSSEMDSLKQRWEAIGGHWQSTIIWAKNNFTLSRADYQNTYEPILYGWAKRVKNHYFTQDRTKSNIWEDIRTVKSEYKDGYTTISFQGFKVKVKGKAEGEVIKKHQRTDIWRHDKPQRSEEHPTMKPVSLCTQAITSSSRRGEIVLDIFLGSGSTLIAAEKAGRICYGMELDPIYVDTIIKRWELYTGQKAVKSTGEE